MAVPSYRELVNAFETACVLGDIVGVTPRVVQELRITLELDGVGRDARVKAVTETVSESGMSVRCSRELTPGESSGFELVLGDANGSLERVRGEAEVVDRRASQGGHNRYCLRFVRFSADGRARVRAHIQAFTARSSAARISIQ